MTNPRLHRSQAVFRVAAMIAAPAIFAPAALAEGDHILIESDAFTFAPGPASLEAGAQVQVLYGDPTGDGIFSMRLKLPDGFHIAPHHHSRPEIVTVIAGTFRIGIGDSADPEATTILKPGSFFAYPPGTVHYAYVEGETVLQLNSTGPWTITYGLDENDPRKR